MKTNQNPIETNLTKADSDTRQHIRLAKAGFMSRKVRGFAVRGILVGILAVAGMLIASQSQPTMTANNNSVGTAQEFDGQSDAGTYAMPSPTGDCATIVALVSAR